MGETIKAYLVATRDLLQGRYKNLRDLAPPHMTAACRPAVFIFPEGVLVRYDRDDNPDLEVLVATAVNLETPDGTPMSLSLTDAAPLISEFFLHCATDPAKYDPGSRAPTFTLSVKSGATNAAREIATQRIVAVVQLPPDGIHPGPVKSRPMPLLSVRNEFDFMIEFETTAGQGESAHRFLLRNRLRIPVGWEAIELFPPYQAEVWNSDLASSWAESDLLGAVLQQNIRDNRFRAIDPKSEARKQMSALIAECERLLNGREEPLHQFIKANPGLLCPTHYRVWSKLSLGKRDTDFVFREPSGEYVLVELERPSHLLFRGDGQQREELTHAIDQVIDWRRYIEDNLRTVQHELGLDGISSNPSCVIVIGRSSSLDEAAKRKLTAIQDFTPKLKIMTYDEMLANAKAAAENVLGPLWYAGPQTEIYLLS